MLQKSLYWVKVCLLLQSTSLVLWERIFEMITLPLNKFLTVYLCSSIGTWDRFPQTLFQTFRMKRLRLSTHSLATRQESIRIKIAKLHHEFFFVDSFGLSINKYPFLKQNFSQKVRTRLQDHPSVCGFYTIYAAFHLFKFQQEEITGVHDVNVLFLWVMSCNWLPIYCKCAIYTMHSFNFIQSN